MLGQFKRFGKPVGHSSLIQAESGGPTAADWNDGREENANVSIEETSVCSLYAIGDIHGELDKFLSLLRQIHLIDEDFHWCGGQSSLVLIGDYVDRGDRGFEVIQAIHHLQEEAVGVGGQVVPLLGNHDVIMIAHARGHDGSFFASLNEDPYLEIQKNHLGNGGYFREVKQLREHLDLLEWYAKLPTLYLAEGVLFGHGNIDYTQFGRTIDEVNDLFKQLNSDACGGMEAFSLLTVRDWPADGRLGIGLDPRYRFNAAEGVQQQLDTFGGNLYIHGHTPEQLTTRHPLSYAGGKAYNIDHALCYHPDLLGYALELSPKQVVKYHVAQPSPRKVLGRLWERYLAERIPLKRVLLRDQIMAQERAMGLEVTPISASDLFDLECALEEISSLFQVTEDPDVSITVQSLLEQLDTLFREWKS